MKVRSAEWLGGLADELDSLLDHKDTFSSVFKGTLQVAENLVTIAQNIKFIIDLMGKVSIGVPGAAPVRSGSFGVSGSFLSTKLPVPRSGSSPSPSNSTPAPIPVVPVLKPELPKDSAFPTRNPFLGLHSPSGIGSPQIGQFAGQGGGGLGGKQKGNDFLNAAQTGLNAMDDTTGKATKSVKELNNGWLQLGDTIGFTLSNSLQSAEGVWQGIKSGFSNMLTGMVADLIGQSAKFAILNILSGGTFGAAQGGFGSFLKSTLGFRASGGPVSAGKPYIVGEKRPELFVPNINGTIVPNVNTASGGDTFIDKSSVHIHASERELDGMQMMDRFQLAETIQKLINDGLVII